MDNIKSRCTKRVSPTFVVNIDDTYFLNLCIDTILTNCVKSELILDIYVLKRISDFTK